MQVGEKRGAIVVVVVVVALVVVTRQCSQFTVTRGYTFNCWRVAKR